MNGRQKKSSTIDVSQIKMLPISQRENDLNLSVITPIVPLRNADNKLKCVANQIVNAKKKNSKIVLMIGAHVLRSGVQNYLIDVMEKGYISCIAMNGACVIHDYEFALIGKTTESVSDYIRDGRFGFWKETARINNIVKKAASEGIGIGEGVGRAIIQSEFPYRDISILAEAYRLGVLTTVHVGIGYDITYQHPNCDGAAYGAASYTDFLRFGKMIENLEGGVLLVFGSAVMAPEVFLKGLSMARNIARQKGNSISRFTTLVCDLQSMPEDFRIEPSKDTPQYYFRPWKTLLVRTVQDGGQSYYVQGDHAETFPALWTAIKEAES